MRHRNRQGIFLLLGSNQGSAAGNLKVAREKIAAQAGKIIGSSSVYKTAAWGKTDQPDFYNQVLELETHLSPQSLLSTLLNIELEMGRVRIEKWGARLIDIDILFIGSSVIDLPELTVPHPALHHRRFTLQPLAEIAFDFEHPVLRKTVSQLLEECTDPLKVEKIIFPKD